jgi:hypothetical protein
VQILNNTSVTLEEINWYFGENGIIDGLNNNQYE